MIHKIYDFDGNLMYLNDAQLQEYRDNVLAALDAALPVLRFSDYKGVLVYGTAGNINKDNLEDLQKFLYDPNNSFKINENVGKERNKQKE